MSKLKIMILCGRSARHIYIANHLCQAATPVAIVNETGSQWNRKKIFNLMKPWVFWNKVWRWLRDRRRYADNLESKYFFQDQAPRFIREDLIHEFPHINDPGVAELADRLQPDVICVFGTSLIRGELLKKGRLGMLNLHGGLSPEYRGADCTFWALHNAEPEMVGCTLHFINEGVDTGDLVAHICPQVRPNEDELVLFWRAVKSSAEVYAEALDRLERGEKLGQSQTKKGKLYQVRDRLWQHEKRLNAMYAEGQFSNIQLPKRVKWFYKNEAISGDN